MKNRKIVQISLVTALAFVFACLLLPYATSQTTPTPSQPAENLSQPAQNTGQTDQNLSQTVQAGHYSITVKVLPAETFHGPKPEMIRDGGAQPNTLDGPNPPNRHLVVFIKEDDKPVENADVQMSYRSAFDSKSQWTTLPVVRMHVAGKGMDTTHFGNNATLPVDGTFEVRVSVNGTGPTTFHFPH